GLDRPPHTAPGMILQKDQPYLVEGGFHRGDLNEDLDTILVFFDHAGNAPHLPFDPFQAGKELGLIPLAVLVHRPRLRPGDPRTDRYAILAAIALAISKVPTAVGSL